MNFLSSFLDDRNLLLENEKTAFAGRFFRRFFEFAAQKTTVTGLEERSNQNLFCQFSLNRRITSRLTPLNQLPVAAASGALSYLSGLDSR